MPKKNSKTSQPITKKLTKKVLVKVNEVPVAETEIAKSVTKNSQLIEMIKGAEEGISLKQICENLKWQPHTVRSAISRLNKNQNLGIINDKIAGSDRVYKLPKKD
jgi:hypothetical protein